MAKERLPAARFGVRDGLRQEACLAYSRLSGDKNDIARASGRARERIRKKRKFPFATDKLLRSSN